MVIKVITAIVESWNIVSCSIDGEALSWKYIEAQVGTPEGVSLFRF